MQLIGIDIKKEPNSLFKNAKGNIDVLASLNKVQPVLQAQEPEK